jgi:hypothetical protein
MRRAGKLANSGCGTVGCVVSLARCVNNAHYHRWTEILGRYHRVCSRSPAWGDSVLYPPHQTRFIDGLVVERSAPVNAVEGKMGE